MKVLFFRLFAAVQEKWPFAPVRHIVDDVTVQVVGNKRLIVDILLNVYLVKKIGRLGFICQIRRLWLAGILGKSRL